MYDNFGVRLALIHSLPAVARAAGVPLPFLMALGGLPADALDDRGRVVSRSQVNTMMQGLVRRGGDATIGFRMADATDPAVLGLSGMSLLVGRTLGEALTLQQRYMPWLQRGVAIGLRSGPLRTQWTHRMLKSDPIEARFLNEGVAAFVVRAVRAISQQQDARIHVILPHRPLVPLRQYEDALRCAVSFAPGGQDLVVGFDTALLTNRNALLRADGPALIDMGITPVPAIFVLSDEDLLEALTRMFEAAALLGRLSLREASVMLGLHPRHLQRRLAEIGTTFEEVLDRWRRQRALALLAEPDAMTMAVAARLGYTDASHFIRAFRRWEGLSPGEYRRLTLGAP